MSTPRLYADLSHLWPRLSPRDDYVAEATWIRSLLSGHLPPPKADRPWRVMELGAGAGQSLTLLGPGIDALAVDAAPDMVRLCRSLYPDLRTMVGDMRSVRTGEVFDAVLAYDAIDYIVDLDALHATCRTAAAHLDPGGLFLAGPTYLRETFENGETVEDDCRDGDEEFSYVASVEALPPEEGGYLLHMTILIREAGRLRMERDCHVCGLFTTAQWQNALAEAGFDLADLPGAKDDGPSSLFLGIRRAEDDVRGATGSR